MLYVFGRFRYQAGDFVAVIGEARHAELESRDDGRELFADAKRAFFEQFSHARYDSAASVLVRRERRQRDEIFR